MKKYIYGITGLAAIALGFLTTSFMSQPTTAHIRVATPNALGWAPFLVALEKGYFNDEMLEVESINVQTGDESLKAVASGDADIALAGIIPYSFIALDNQSVQLVAQTSYVRDNQIIARRSSGITQPDMRGKRIGYAKTTASDIGIRQFLHNHEIAESDVTLVQLKPLAMPTALISGQIDAYSAWEPHVYNGKNQLGADAIVFDDEKSIYTWHGAIEVRAEYANQNRDELVKFFRAWVRAEMFIREHPEEARAIVSKGTRIPEEVLAEVWEKYTFSIGLPDDVADTLAVDLSWANSQRTEPRPLPAVRDLIHQGVWEAYENTAAAR